MKKKHSFWRTLRRYILPVVMLALIGMNALAWQHAWSMTHFADPNEPIPAPETLSPGDWVRLALFGVPLPRPQNHHTPADMGYAYEEHRITLPHDEWLEAWLVSHPQPRGVVLLFHGYAASKQQVMLPASVFYQMGYSTFLVDFRGSGGSSGASTTLGMREAKDVAHAVAYVQQMWPEQRIILYGTSMGSSALLRAVALEGVQPDAIIAETPFDRLSSAVRVRMHLMNVPTFPTTELLVFWGGVQHGANAFEHNPVEYARSVTCPTLLLGGAEDIYISAAELESIYQALQGPRTQIMMPAVGHDVLLPKTPEVQQQVAQFLDQLP